MEAGAWEWLGVVAAHDRMLRSGGAAAMVAWGECLGALAAYRRAIRGRAVRVAPPVDGWAHVADAGGDWLVWPDGWTLDAVEVTLCRAAAGELRRCVPGLAAAVGVVVDIGVDGDELVVGAGLPGLDAAVETEAADAVLDAVEAVVSPGWRRAGVWVEPGSTGIRLRLRLP